MNPRDYVTNWHSFEHLVKADTKVYFVGARVRSLVHACSRNPVRMTKIRPFFGGVDTAAPTMLDEVSIQLEKPIDRCSRSGLCSHCNELYVAEDPPK